MTRYRMLARMLTQSLAVRRGRALTVLLAVIVAATVVTANLNLYIDVGAKLRREFRSYGANVVITQNNGAPLAPDALQTVRSLLRSDEVAAPLGFAAVRAADETAVVAVGTDMESVRRLNPWWSVTAWPQAPGEALMGARSAEALASRQPALTLRFQDRELPLKKAGILRTGGEEDSRVYLSMQDFQQLTGSGPTTIELRVVGSSQEISQRMQVLAAALPGTEVRPVRQFVEGEARVLDKARTTFWAASLIIALTAALCVLATLTSWVLDRRKDFAVMKALGASQAMLNGLFAMEAASLGAAGSLLGFGAGVGIAAWIGKANFDALITPRFSLLPWVFMGSILLTLLSAILPLLVLRRVQPAVILKGE